MEEQWNAEDGTGEWDAYSVDVCGFKVEVDATLVGAVLEL